MTKESSAQPPKFVIVTLPRSGSYNLVSLLNSAPDIICHGEVFKRDVVELRPLHLEKMGMKALVFDLRGSLLQGLADGPVH